MQLWDRPARRIAAWQLCGVVVLLVVHLIYAYLDARDTDASASSDADGEGGTTKCLEGNLFIHMRERLFYMAECLLLLVYMCPTPFIAAFVGSSSFSNLFAEWPLLMQSALAIALGATILAASFYVEQPEIQISARQLGVQVPG